MHFLIYDSLVYAISNYIHLLILCRVSLHFTAIMLSIAGYTSDGFVWMKTVRNQFIYKNISSAKIYA
jgi:hypothetical protein